LAAYDRIAVSTIRASLSLGHGSADEQFQRSVVVDEAGLVVGARNAAVTMAGVFTQAGIRDQHQRRHCAVDGAQRQLHDAVGRPGLGALPVLGMRQPEQQHRRDAQVSHLARILDDAVD
jgi:hypothetical protein